MHFCVTHVVVPYMGAVWLAIGLVYLGFLTRGFSKQPPEMDFQEAA